MISPHDYFGSRFHHKEVTSEVRDNADILIFCTNSLLREYQDEVDHDVPLNPNTDTQISGMTEGGFRLKNCKQGARQSSHKQGKGVDIFDPFNELDNWIKKYNYGHRSNYILERWNLYIEHPSKTKTWVHLTIRPPRSGNRIFYP